MPSLPTAGSLLASISSAPYAGTSSATDTFSGVRLGRWERSGKTASSKTCARPVLCSVLSGNLARKLVRRSRPVTWVAESSTRVRRTGMKSGHCLEMSWVWVVVGRS